MTSSSPGMAAGGGPVANGQPAVAPSPQQLASGAFPPARPPQPLGPIVPPHSAAAQLSFGSLAQPRMAAPGPPPQLHIFDAPHLPFSLGHHAFSAPSPSTEYSQQPRHPPGQYPLGSQHIRQGSARPPEQTDQANFQYLSSAALQNYGFPAAGVRGKPSPVEAYNSLQYLGMSHDPHFLQRFENDAVLALDNSLANLNLNPMADEFVPPFNDPRYHRGASRKGPVYPNRQAPDLMQHHLAPSPGNIPRGGWGSGGSGVGGRGGRSGQARGGRNNRRSSGGGQKNLAENVRRTIYICDIDSQVTEEQLAMHFIECGTVVDCRICGDPNSAMRFAFIEFTDENAVSQALLKSGTALGNGPIRVLRSKTAIVPVNNDYLPRSHQERELCVRTVYAANIDKKVERSDVRNFFEALCGKVSKLRLLGDYQHATRIAFIEFEHADGAMAALNCSGVLLGSLPIRVSPSKTPVRSDPRDDADEGPGGHVLVAP